MTLVIDASVVVAALVDTGPSGTWAETLLAVPGLAAPHLMPVEVASALRRLSLAGHIGADTASMALADLLGLDVELFPYGTCAERVWELRTNVTPYDAWYVALAEAFEAPLASLDDRLSRSPGPTCTFLLPDP